MTTKQKLLSYNNQKAKYFLRQDCSACFYATPAKRTKRKRSNKLKQRTVANVRPLPKAGLSCKKH